MINDIASRAAKTFFQAFVGFLIPEVILILKNVTTYNFDDWKTWVLPIVCGALAAGFSAIQNTIINARKGDEPEE